MKNLLAYIILLIVFAAIGCSSEAYNDGQWWAKECCKMLKDKDYNSPVSKQYMRMKFHTDNCEPNFYNGFRDYSDKENLHQEYLINQLQMMVADCEIEKKQR